MATAHRPWGLARSGAELNVDLRDGDAVQRAVATALPDIVVHTAALTDVDACERDPELAHAQHVLATRHLVQALARHAPRARLVHVSTDQVYGGPGPHAEHATAPCNAYGRTKRAAEDEALRHPGALVVRTNFLVPGAGFAGWALEQLSGQAALHVFDDVWFNPLHVQDVAELLGQLVTTGAVGTLNLGASGEGMSKGDAVRWWARRLGWPEHRIVGGSVKDAVLSAPRPHDMRMDVTRAQGVLGITLPTVPDTLERVAVAWQAAHP